LVRLISVALWNCYIVYNESSLNLVCVYRSPCLLQESFLDSSEIFLDGIDNNISCVFCGDINIDLNKINAVSVRYWVLEESQIV